MSAKDPSDSVDNKQNKVSNDDDAIVENTASIEYRNNPDLIAPIYVDVHAPVNIRDEQIMSAVHTICCHFDKNHTNNNDNNNGGDNIVESFSNHCGEDKIKGLSVRQLGGGLSNHLFVVSSASSSSSSPSVLVRIHPDQSSTDHNNSNEEEFSLINREKENIIMAHLSSQKLAPLYYGRFTNGRIEEFLENVRTLRYDEITSPTFGKQVARAMAGLHKVHGIPSSVSSCEDDQKEEMEGNGDIMGEVVCTIQKWFQMVETVLLAQQGTQRERLFTMFSYLQKEWEWLYPILFSSKTKDDDIIDDICSRKKAHHFFRQVVFTHMDCQSLNILTPITPPSATASMNNNDEKEEEKDQQQEILKSPTSPTVKLIDFEYAGYNRRAIDIANTFCECCDMNNLCPDYQSEYPDLTNQNIFLYAYVREADPDLALYLDNNNDDEIDDDNNTQHQEKSNTVGGGCYNRRWTIFLTEGQEEVGRHTLISHLIWAIWSIVQSGNGCDIEFDYVKYAELRVNGYRYFKKRFWE
mmetsp:Transcript_25207/g.33461  ORF Transcript_25207/g.33461 Transcript_25207/m.33461 type:complete len:523 (+) Transcript_25207:33-1601(+)